MIKMPKGAKQVLRISRMVWCINKFNNVCNKPDISLSTTIPDCLHDLICGSTADYQIFKTADGATDGATSNLTPGSQSQRQRC